MRHPHRRGSWHRSAKHRADTTKGHSARIGLAMLLAGVAVPAQAETTRFNICYDYGCKSSAEVRLDTPEWELLESLFAIDQGARAERESVAAAVAMLERIAGNQTATSADLGGNIDGAGLPGQMDCIDESTNTTVYLSLLAQRGWLRWHRPAPRRLRAPWLFDQHWTAVLESTVDGREYAVDSWFLDNGQPPRVQPLADWLAKQEPPANEPQSASEPQW